ncbi:MAG: group 1 truncated hemoglobin [Polyangiaceae bacterium]
MTTPYEAIGGEAKVREVLRLLYDRLFEDPMVGFLFEGRDKGHIVEAQVSFTCGFLGGPQKYSGRSLPEAHARLPLLPGHFDRRHRLLEDVLRDEHVPDEVSRVWLRIDETLRPSVLLAAQGARSASRQPT